MLDKGVAGYGKVKGGQIVHVMKYNHVRGGFPACNSFPGTTEGGSFIWVDGLPWVQFCRPCKKCMARYNMGSRFPRRKEGSDGVEN